MGRWCKGGFGGAGNGNELPNRTGSGSAARAVSVGLPHRSILKFGCFDPVSKSNGTDLVICFHISSVVALLLTG